MNKKTSAERQAKVRASGTGRNEVSLTILRTTRDKFKLYKERLNKSRESKLTYDDLILNWIDED